MNVFLSFLFFLAKPFDPTFFLSCTVSNVICCLVFGQRFSYDDKHFLYLLQIISDTLKFGSSSHCQVKAKVTITWNWHGRWVTRRRVLGLDLKCLKKVAQNRADCAHQLLCSHCNNNLLKNSLSMCHKWMLSDIGHSNRELQYNVSVYDSIKNQMFPNNG